MLFLRISFKQHCHLILAFYKFKLTTKRYLYPNTIYTMKALVGLLWKFLAIFSKNRTLAIFFFKGEKYVSTSKELISKEALLLTLWLAFLLSQVTAIENRFFFFARIYLTKRKGRIANSRKKCCINIHKFRHTLHGCYHWGKFSLALKIYSQKIFSRIKYKHKCTHCLSR